MPNYQTTLYDWHLEHKARIVPFAGWDMPVQYTSVIEEHKAVRSAVGVFDISHMARVHVSGPDALAFLELIFTNAVSTMKVGQVRYGLVCNEQGGILDDILVSRYETDFELCVNAGNREKILGWLHTHSLGKNLKIVDNTFATSMLAVQGPRAVALLTGLFPIDHAQLKYYFAARTSFQGEPAIVSRTGYTGEDGFEIIVPNKLAVALWNEIVQRGALPCGLGARDTLRLEAAMPLYGHELNETIDPIQAGLGWAVKLEKGEFFGREAIRRATTVEPTSRMTRVGLKLEGKRAAREGSGIESTSGTSLGTVTSGSYVPTLDCSIAMGMIPLSSSQPGTELVVDIRGSKIPARVVPLPFYKKSN